MALRSTKEIKGGFERGAGIDTWRYMATSSRHSNVLNCLGLLTLSSEQVQGNALYLFEWDIQIVGRIDVTKSVRRCVNLGVLSDCLGPQVIKQCHLLQASPRCWDG